MAAAAAANTNANANGTTNSISSSSLDLTVQVVGVSSINDLSFFFSYCGTVHSLHLQTKSKDQPQIAFVTFVQPFAYRTALLLNGAVVAGNPIQVLPLTDSTTHPKPDKMNNATLSKENQGFLPIMQATVQSMASKGVGILNKTKVEMEENCKLVERGRSVVHQTRSAIGTMISNNRYLTNRPAWVSEAVDMASKCAFDGLTTSGKKDRINLNKQK